MVREYANGPGDQGSTPGRVITKTKKMVFDITLLDTLHYKVRIKGKVEQSREWSSALRNGVAQRCSQCILQPQLTGQYTDLNIRQFYFR